MKNWIRNTAMMILLLLASIGRGQNYPVQAFVQLTPPYSSYLPDYSDPFNNQLKVLLTLTDFSVPSYQVKLRLSIEGQGYTIQSADLTNFPAILLSPGVPVEISGSDLAPYLATQNLIFNGIDVANYEQSKILPEGPATICIEVVDIPTGAILGNESCAQSWFYKHQSPLLNLPICGSEITPTSPQSVMFQWTPMHMSIGQNTNYQFELFKVYPEGDDPNVVVGNPFLKIADITTSNTFVLYDLTNTPLEIGEEYVWRVRASDISGRDLFNNSGYSQVCTFTYGNVAGSLLDGYNIQLNSVGTSKRQGKATWNTSGIIDEYVLEVRKTGNPNYQWFPYPTTNGELKVNNLEPETEYECRVKGKLAEAETDWSNTSVFTTLAQQDYACNNEAIPGLPPVFKPASSIGTGNIVQVGQFEMIVASAQPSGIQGSFTGEGVIFIPFMMMPLAVEFENIMIDENLTVHAGRVNAITKGVAAWVNEGVTHTIPGTVDSYTSDQQDSIVVFYFGNESLEFDWPTPGNTVTVTDETNKQYVIDEYGNVTESYIIEYDNESLDATANYQVIFKEASSDQFGFDEKEYDPWTLYYPCIILSDSSHYFTSYKAIKDGQTDQVKAELISDQSATTITFKDEDGSTYSSSVAGNTYTIDLNTLSDPEYLYAYDNNGLKLGKLNLIVYEQKNIDVVLVPVNGATATNDANLTSYLNNIYRAANLNFNITTDSNFQSIFDIDGNGLQSASDEELSNYSAEMKALRDEYFDANPSANKDAIYLFVVPSFDDPTADGYMVRGKSMGFIKSGAADRTYAHELGHGFQLKHSFPANVSGSTTNLMDYSNGEDLAGFQWKGIRDFSFAFSFLDDAEDGEAASLSNLEYLDEFRNIDGHLCVLTPAGKPLILAGDLSQIDFVTAEDSWKLSQTEIPIGTVGAFTLNSVKYLAKKSGNQFIGYGLEGQSPSYIDSLSKNYEFIDPSDSSYTKVLTGIPCFENGEFIFKVFPTSLYETSQLAPTFAPNYKGAGTMQSESFIASHFLNESAAKNVPVSFSTPITTEEYAFFSYLANFTDICGKDAIYAFSSANMFHDHPELLNCFEDNITQTNNNVDYYNEQDYTNNWLAEDFKVDNTATTSIVGLDPVERYITLKSNDPSLDDNFHFFFNQALDQLVKNVVPSIASQEAFQVLDLHNLSKYFDLYDEYEKMCILKNLDYATRIEFIQSYATWGTLSTRKEELLVDLVSTTPSADVSTLISDLAANNYALYWGLYADINSSKSDRFVAAVSRFIIQTTTPPSNLTTWPQTRTTQTPFIDIFKTSVVGTNLITANTYQKQGSDIRIDWAWMDDNMSVSYYFEGDPFEMVHIKMAENFQFASTGGEQLQTGDSFIVPACWAYWILDRQNTIDNWKTVRIVANIAAATITAGTSAPLWLITTEIALNGTDIVLACVEDDVLSGNYSLEAQALFNQVNIIVMAGDLSFFTLAATTGLVNRWKINQSKLVDDIKAAKPDISKFNKLKNDVQGIWDALKNYNTAAFTGDLVLLRGTIETALRDIKLQKYGKYLTSAADCEMSVKQSKFLYAKTSNQNGLSIAEVIDDVDDVVLENIHWADNFHNPATDGALNRVIYELEDVPYKATVGGQKQIGDLEVVESAVTKKVFVRVIQPSTNTASLFPSLVGRQGAISKVETILNNGAITQQKLVDAIETNMAAIISAADDVELGKILDRLNLAHVDDAHLDKITQRINDYSTLKQDLINNPDWFETFEDILNNPGKYWEIIDDAVVPTNAALNHWAQGYWWKNLRDMAQNFEKIPGLDEFKIVSGISDNSKIVEQVTLEFDGVKIRVDYLGFDQLTGKYSLGEAKFSTKNKNWGTDWLNASTDNQKTVFQAIQNGNVNSIVVKATDAQKLSELAGIGLANNSSISFANITLDIIGSNANQQTVKSVVSLK